MDKEATRPAEMSVAERQGRRFRFLHKLYESTDGNTNSLVDLNGLAEALGLKPEEASSVGAYLAHEGLIQGSDWVVVTHAGLLEVEAALSKPSEPTAHFHANIADVLAVSAAAPAPGAAAPSSAPIEGVITSVAGAMQDDQPGPAPAPAPGPVEPAGPVDHAAMRVLLDLITGSLEQLALGGDLRREVVADIASARAQLSAPKPKPVILREVLRSLHDMVEGAIGSGVAPREAWGPILAQLSHMADALK